MNDDMELCDACGQLRCKCPCNDTPVRMFEASIRKTVDYHSEENDLSIAEAVGVLQIEIHRLLTMMFKE